MNLEPQTMIKNCTLTPTSQKIVKNMTNGIHSQLDGLNMEYVRASVNVLYSLFDETSGNLNTNLITSLR